MSMHCPICLKTAAEDELPWVSLYCGHVLHDACLRDIKRYSRSGVQCPICRDEYRNGEERKLFFAMETAEGSTGDGELDEELDDQQARQLRDRIRNLEAQLSRERHNALCLKTDLVDMKENNAEMAHELEVLEHELECLNREFSAEREENRKAQTTAMALRNKIANLKVSLEQERTLSAKQRIVFDTQLHGASLARQLKNIVDPSMKSPEWFRELLDKRNRMLMNLTKKLEQMDKEKSLLQKEVDLLQQEMSQQKSFLQDGVSTQKTSPIEKLNASRLNLRLDEIDAEAPIWESEIVQNDGTLPSGKENKLSDEIDLVIISDDDEPQIVSEKNKSVRDILSASNTNRAKPAVLSKAGPSKIGLKAAPGPSFIGNSDFATTGLEDSGTFIKTGPDGKGGWSSVYQNPSMQRNTRTMKRKRTISSTKDISSFFQK